MTQIVDKDGNVLNKAGLIAKATTVTQPTKYKFTEDVYELVSYQGDRTGETRKRRKFFAGQIVGSDAIDALSTFNAGNVTAVTPSTIATAGGTLVTIEGNSLHSVTSVTFGGTAGTALKKISERKIQVTSPARTAGSHAVVVVTSAGNVAAGNVTAA